MDEVEEFLDSLNQKIRKKIVYNMRKAQVANDSQLFKKLNNHVWEFRTLHKQNVLPAFRILGQI